MPPSPPGDVSEICLEPALTNLPPRPRDRGASPPGGTARTPPPPRREFVDEGVLITHQRNKHFKCEVCGKKMNSGAGLRVHCLNVHTMELATVPAASAGRDSIFVDVVGMNGVPEDVLAQHYGDEPPAKRQAAEAAYGEPGYGGYGAPPPAYGGYGGGYGAPPPAYGPQGGYYGGMPPPPAGYSYPPAQPPPAYAAGGGGYGPPGGYAPPPMVTATAPPASYSAAPSTYAAPPSAARSAVRPPASYSAAPTTAAGAAPAAPPGGALPGPPPRPSLPGGGGGGPPPPEPRLGTRAGEAVGGKEAPPLPGPPGGGHGTAPPDRPREGETGEAKGDRREHGDE